MEWRASHRKPRSYCVRPMPTARRIRETFDRSHQRRPHLAKGRGRRSRNGPRVFGFLPPSNAPLFGGICFNRGGSHRGRGYKKTRTAWATAFLIREKGRCSEWDDLSADVEGLCGRISINFVLLVV